MMKQIKIYKLSDATTDALRADIITPSHLVIELILNALDARATNVRVEVNPTLHTLIVTDNGKGIPPSDFP